MQEVSYPTIFAGPILLLTLLTLAGIIIAVILIKLLNGRRSDSTATAGSSPSREERTSLLRERRDRYQQERTRILGMVDGGQISGEQAALLLNTVERETSTMACPFCEQDIRIEALKCHHCGQYLVEEDRHPKKLTRSNNTLLSGVCGGIAEYTNMDPSVIRILTVLISLSTGIISALLIYLVAALVMPSAEQTV